MLMAESERKITPKDLIVIYSFDGTISKIFSVGLKIEAILGKEAARIYQEYRYHSSIEKGYQGYEDMDPREARISFEKFIKIAGFSPDDLKVELYVTEKKFGLDDEAAITFNY